MLVALQSFRLLAVLLILMFISPTHAAVSDPSVVRNIKAIRQRDTATAITLSPATTVTPGAAGIVTASGSVSTSIPQPFDTGVGNNFTATSCPQFLNYLISDDNFQQCYPFSLLIETSNSFFVAEKSFFRTTQILDVTCQVNLQQCSKLMASYASRITTDDNCGVDYRLQNPMVVQAFIGLSSYVSMNKAGCIKDTDGSYCFAKAVTNSTSTTMDTWPYWVPLGTSLPASTQTSCSPCIQRTMQSFADTGGPFSQQYARAASQINTHCGANFVPEKSISSAVSRPTITSASISLVVFLISVFTMR